jgi:hypothetical protein
MDRRRQSFSRSRLLIGLLASMLVGGGCATIRIGALKPPRIRAQNVEYDRFSLRFLFIVQSMADGTTLDRRLIENTNVGIVERPVTCDSGAPLRYMLRDQFPPAPSSDDLIQLKEGESFPREVEIFLFDTAGPECVRVEITLTHPDAEEPITIVAREGSAAQSPVQ